MECVNCTSYPRKTVEKPQETQTSFNAANNKHGQNQRKTTVCEI